MFDKTVDQIMAGFSKTLNELEVSAERSTKIIEDSEAKIKSTEVVMKSAEVEKTRALKFAMNIRGLME